MKPQELAERGIRAGYAWDEFVSPALDVVRAEYMAALTKLAANEPWETAKITKLAVANRVIDRVEEQVRMIIAHGVQASKDLERARQIESIPEAKRKWI